MSYECFNRLDVYKCRREESCKWASLWLFNPLIMAISTRGSADCIMSFLLCLLLYLMATQRTVAAAVVYAVAIVFKLYPVIYALALFMYLQLHLSPTRSQSNKHVATTINLRQLILPNCNTLIFAAVAASVLIALVACTFVVYGYEAIFETYVYHLIRKDTKHNFSVYFYMFYLDSGNIAAHPSHYHHLLDSAINFLPLCLQAVCLICVALKFSHDLPLCFFFSTFCFVTLNKVCTSQYFVWYLTFLPLVAYKIHTNITLKRAISLAVLWFVGQLVWPYPAYLLEFEGVNTFEFIWLASVFFFLINVYVMCSLVHSCDTKDKLAKPEKIS